MKIGDRVELGPHLDTWMRGMRCGTVVGFGRPHHGRETVRVILDRSTTMRRFEAGDLRVISGSELQLP